MDREGNAHLHELNSRRELRRARRDPSVAKLPAEAHAEVAALVRCGAQHQVRKEEEVDAGLLALHGGEHHAADLLHQNARGDDERLHTQRQSEERNDSTHAYAYKGQRWREAALDRLECVLVLSARALVAVVGTVRESVVVRHLSCGSIHCIATLKEAAVALGQARKHRVIRARCSKSLAIVLQRGGHG